MSKRKNGFKTVSLTAAALLFALLAFLPSVMSSCSVITASCEHVYVLTDEIAPDCVTDGTRTYKCSVCGDSYTQVYRPASGHNYIEKVKPATCVEPERHVYTCDVCGDSYELVEGDCGEHDYHETVIPATCVEPERRIFTCAVCGGIYELKGDAVQPEAHNYEYTVTPPTERTKGYTTRICTLCGETDINNISYLSYGDRITILLYHHIMTNDEISKIKGDRAMFVSTKSFTEQLTVLRDGGYFVMTLDDAVAALSGREPIPGKAVCICFDDGYKSNIERAAPILKEFSYPATIFAIQSYLGGEYEPDFDPLRRQYLTVPEYKPYSELITLGCHTWKSHCDLRDYTREQFDADLKKCTDSYPLYNKYFAYPLGYYSNDIISNLRDAGFTAAFTTVNRAATRDDDIYKLPRIGIFNNCSISRFKRLIGYSQ